MMEARKGVREDVRVCNGDMTMVKLTTPISMSDAGKVS